MLEWLARWWSRKYKLPWNHELFQERTPISLLAEYYLDFYEEHPLEVHRQADGEIQLKDTGDKLIDKWEEKIAQGHEPDLTEAFTPEGLEKLQRLQARSREDSYELGGFTMKTTMERIEHDARLQGLRPEAQGLAQPPETASVYNAAQRFSTFGYDDD